MVFENDQTALRLRSHGATVVSRPSKNFDILSSVSMSTAGSCIEHVVQRGDWLYDIGRRHNVDVGTLLIANPSLRNPDSLLVGSRISIPRKSSSSSSSFYTPPSTSSRASATRAKAHREQSTRSAFTSLLMRPEMPSLSKTFSLLGQILSCKDREHRVGDGESLACLAEKYGTTVKALKKLNNMEDDVIYSGSVLKIDWHSADRAVLGRKASVQERNSLIDDVPGNTTQPIKVVNPVLSTCSRSERLRRVHPIPIQETVRVKYGDTLVDIASAHGLSSEELQRLNNLRNENIFEGDVLAVSAGSSVKELSENRSGRRRSNRLLFSRQCEGFRQKLGAGGPEQTLKEQLTTGNLKLEGRWKRKRKGFQLSQDKWVRFSSPVTEGSLSSTFGWRWGAFHEGVDVAADQGSPILASDKGTVTFAGWSGGYGYLVAIQHEGGFVTRYAHCCAIHSRVGQQVVKGQQVAAVGATGRATGPHLHFEVRKNGEALDPLKWVIL